MPDVKVYIRADDINKWNAIEKKSEFLHDALCADDFIVHNRKGEGSRSIYDVPKTQRIDYGLPVMAERVVDLRPIKPKTTDLEFVPKPPDPDTGYPCCTKAKPCKHWVFDGASSEWRNEITGKTKEVVI